MHTRFPLALPFLLGPLLAQAPATPTPTPDPAALQATVRGAVQWLATQAVPVDGQPDAVLFRPAEGSKQPASATVYGGSAGVLIFLENAAAVLDDATARALADRTAKGLRASKRLNSRDQASWSRGGPMGDTGLYTGDAGVGQAFLVRHALRQDPEALAAAVEVGDALLSRARTEDGALRFHQQVDIIFGNAGTALFLLDLAQATGEAKYLDAAKATGLGLVEDAVRAPSSADAKRELPTWVLTMGRRQVHMPNFSHGTAGVAYALARIGQATGEQRLLDAARDGAQWLIEHAVADGDGLKWAASDQAPVFMGGWCHGPVGTGRLFLLLGSITGDPHYREVAEQGARFVIAYAAAAEQKGADGKVPYVPPSYCCGVAGVVEFFCDLHRITKDPAHAAFANKAGDYLVQAAIAEGDGRKWRNGQSAPGVAVAADSQGFNTDLMLGAAGEALALLRLATLDRTTDPIVGLPDRAVVAPAAAPAKR